MRTQTSYIDSTFRNPSSTNIVNQRPTPFFEREGEQSNPFFQTGNALTSESRASENVINIPNTPEEAQAYFTQGKEAYGNENYQLAEQYFQALLSSPIIQSESRDRIVKLEYNLALVYFRLNRFEEALPLFRTYQAEFPNNFEVASKINSIERQLEGTDPLQNSNIPPPEVITSTTQAQNMGYQFLSQTTGIWSRQNLSFTEGVREYADQETERGDRVLPTRTIASENIYIPQWGINFSAIDYQSWPDMPRIAQYTLQQGSPFQRAAASEFDHMVGGAGIVDPTASQIRETIMHAINEMQPQLIENIPGKLVVFIEGHGGRSGFAGVDENYVTPEEMMTLAQIAQRRRIHITFILDSCNIGALVNESNEAHIEHFRGLIPQNAESPAEASWATRRLEIAQHLRDDVQAIGDGFGIIYSWRRLVNRAQSSDRSLSCSDGFCGIDENFQPLQNSSDIEFPHEALDAADQLAQGAASLHEHILQFHSEIPNGNSLMFDLVPYLISTKLLGRLDRFSLRQFGTLRESTAETINQINEIIRVILEEVRDRLRTDQNPAPAVNIDHMLAEG